jgi:hypothetical protein
VPSPARPGPARAIVPDVYPIDYIPNGVRLTGYGGDASDLPTAVLQDFLDAVAVGDAVVPVHRIYTLDADMETRSHIPVDGIANRLPNGRQRADHVLSSNSLSRNRT